MQLVVYLGPWKGGPLRDATFLRLAVLQAAQHPHRAQQRVQRADYLRPLGWRTQPWRGVLGGWRMGDERLHGLRLQHHLRRACHYVVLLAERQRDSQLADRVLGAMQGVRCVYLLACCVSVGVSLICAVSRGENGCVYHVEANEQQTAQPCCA